MGLIAIYRTIQPNRKEYTIVSASHGDFSNMITYLVTKQTSTDTEIGVTISMLLHHNGVKIEFNHNTTPFIQTDVSTTVLLLGQGRNKERN